MVKQGTPYEQVVADVLGVLNPGATVSQGQWIQGPDGRRDLDVLIEGTVNGENRRVLIECKDWNRATTGPVGIGVIDALDSKVRDLKLDAAFVCSNAGFTADAIHKAKRLGIGLIAVIRENDPRIRYEVLEEIYIRHIKLEGYSADLFNSDRRIDLSDFPGPEIKYRGLSLLDWVVHRVLRMLASQPIVDGSYTDTLRFRTPTQFDLPNGQSVVATSMGVYFRITGIWREVTATIRASEVVYDWMRSFIRLPPNKKFTLHYDFNWDDGRQIAEPPAQQLLQQQYEDGIIALRFLRISQLPDPPAKYPDLDKLIVEEDVYLGKIFEFPAQAFRSSKQPPKP